MSSGAPPVADDSRPTPLDASFAAVLQATKARVVRPSGSVVAITQHGAATLHGVGRPPWPQLPPIPEPGEAVIETYVCRRHATEPTSDNEPYASAWLPIVTWMHTTVRKSLSEFGLDLGGDAYLTASLTPRSMHEGLPHLDDDLFEPQENVGVVAIIGELAGPVIAGAPLEHDAPAPSTQLRFDATQLARFDTGAIRRCQCAADELVVFPQFGQLHAGPTADDLPGEAAARQLLVLRAKASGSTRPAATPR